MEQQKKVTTSTLLSYGIGDLYGGGSFLIISMLFIYFLTDVVGMNVSLAGFVVLVGKIWDYVSWIKKELGIPLAMMSLGAQRGEGTESYDPFEV